MILFTLWIVVYLLLGSVFGAMIEKRFNGIVEESRDTALGSEMATTEEKGRIDTIVRLMVMLFWPGVILVVLYLAFKQR